MTCDHQLPTCDTCGREAVYVSRARDRYHRYYCESHAQEALLRGDVRKLLP